jgi:hypothetical protein
MIAVLVLLISAAARADDAAIMDWAKGDAQDTAANCGPFAFAHMKDRHVYTLYVRGTQSGTCSFRADGLRFHLPPNFGPTTPGTATIFAFARFGSDVLVSWTPGY